MTQALNFILIGAIAIASLIIALFFLRFWKSSRDRFFLFFSASFFLEGVSRIFQGLGGFDDTGVGAGIGTYYLIRILSYCLILVAIIDKNFVGIKGK